MAYREIIGSIAQVAEQKQAQSKSLKFSVLHFVERPLKKAFDGLLVFESMKCLIIGYVVAALERLKYGFKAIERLGWVE